jgi:hypothetical protein
MKNKRRNLLDLIMISLVVFGLFKSTLNAVEDNTEPTLEEVCLDEEICVVTEDQTFKMWFDYTYDRFKVYNKDIDTSTVELFIKVAENYGFTKDSTQFRLVVGQVLLESGANQRWYKGHPYEGDLVISYAGAIGRTQILPSTAQYFMSKILSDEDVSTFKRFGASDFKFSKNKNLTTSEKNLLAKEWLSNSDNNIIMWGYIMRYNMSKTGDNIIKSLIAYNAGRGGLNIFMKRGNSIWKHEYVKGIYNRLKRVDRKIS